MAELPRPAAEEVAAEVQRMLTLASTRRLGRGLGLGPEDLEDAAAAALVSLLRCRHRIKLAGLAGYAYRSVRNAIKTFAAKKWRHRIRSLDAIGGGQFDVPVSGRSPLEQLADRDFLEQVVVRLRAGSERQRRIVEMRLQELTLAQTAGVLGVPLVTVWREWQQRVNAARELLH